MKTVGSLLALLLLASACSSSVTVSPAAARFVGCTASTVDPAVPVDDLKELCNELSIDWTTVVANTPAMVVMERLTESAAAMVANPVPDMPRQVVAADDDGRMVSIATPQGAVWSEGRRATLELPSRESIFTDLELDSGCDGSCGPQDWAAKMQGIDSPLTRQRILIGAGIENDHPIDSGWLLTGSEGADYEILVVLWNDQADHYFTCEASIDDSDRSLVDQTISIFLSALPDWPTF